MTPDDDKWFSSTIEAALFWTIATAAAFWFPLFQLARKALAHE